jgi:predicted GNAT family acetyltransferase
MTDVIDNQALDRFDLTIDGHTTASSYALKDGVIAFMHTEVPEALAGQGIGSKQTKGALDQARARGLKVVAFCPFVKAYFEKHPEYADLLKQAGT